ncbi:hypothetical protein P8452_38879 [Trifolium repens]|nr:hypothetical protein P8452_38879 [Trifolium repens]
MFRHLSSDSFCSRCNHLHEIALHTLRDCPLSWVVWITSHFSNSANFLVGDVCDWFRLLATGLARSLFVATGWEIWKARNEEKFQSNRKPTWLIVNAFLTHNFLLRILNIVNMAEITRQVEWIPPTAPCLKLDVDGSSSENLGCGGFDGFICDDIGE